MPRHESLPSSWDIQNERLLSGKFLCVTLEEQSNTDQSIRVMTGVLGQLESEFSADTKSWSVDPGHGSDNRVQHLLPRTAHVGGSNGFEHYIVLFDRSLWEEQVVNRKDG